jgi:hypothetical protein
MTGLFVRNPEYNRRSGECQVLPPDTFAAFSPATQEAYIHAAQDPESGISDELRAAVQTALNAMTEISQE